MIKKIILILLFYIPNLLAANIQCNFEEVYSNGDIQAGYILIKKDKLRYEYKSEKLFTVFFDGETFYSVNNNDKTVINKITDNTEVLLEIMSLAKEFSSVEREYNNNDIYVKLEKSNEINFYKRIAIRSNNVQVSIYFHDCLFDKLDDKYFLFRKFLDLD